MENFDLTRTVSDASVSMMMFMMVFLIVLQIFVYMFIRRNYPGKNAGVILGMASRLIICNVILTLLELGEHYIGSAILGGQENEAMITSLKNIGQVFIIVIDSGVIVYCAEFAYRHFSYQPGVSGLGNAMSFALGFSLVETLKVTAETLSDLIMALSINGIGLETLMESLAESQTEAFISDITPVLDSTAFYYFGRMLDRLAFSAFVFALMVMVQLVTKKILNQAFLLKLSGLYVIYYIPALLKQLGLVNGNAVVVLGVVLISVFACMFSWQVLKRADPEDAAHLSDVWHQGLFKAVFGTKQPKKKESINSKFKRL